MSQSAASARPRSRDAGAGADREIGGSAASRSPSASSPPVRLPIGTGTLVSLSCGEADALPLRRRAAARFGRGESGGVGDETGGTSSTGSRLRAAVRLGRGGRTISDSAPEREPAVEARDGGRLRGTASDAEPRRALLARDGDDEAAFGAMAERADERPACALRLGEESMRAATALGMCVCSNVLGGRQGPSRAGRTAAGGAAPPPSKSRASDFHKRGQGTLGGGSGMDVEKQPRHSMNR